jgi:hypothetical protein
MTTRRRKLSTGLEGGGSATLDMGQVQGGTTPPKPAGAIEGAAAPPSTGAVQGGTAPPREPAKSGADKAPPIHVGWGNIVRDTLRVSDPAGIAKRLRDELSLGEDRTSYGLVLEALDKSARNIDDASRLYRAAKLEEENYERLTAERMEVMRTRALGDLMGEYQAKKRPSPTIDAVKDRMIANWGDEYHAIEGRRGELHALTRSLENLLEAWKSRAADLRIMAGQAARPH